MEGQESVFEECRLDETKLVDGWQVSFEGEVKGEEVKGKALGKEERGASLEGKVVEVGRVETGGGREGGGYGRRLECGGEEEEEEGGGGGGRLGGGGGRGRCDSFWWRMVKNLSIVLTI